MICSKCGGIIGDGLSVCKNCGERIELYGKALDQVVVKELDSGSLMYFRPSKNDIESLDVSELSELYSSNEILSALKSLYTEHLTEDKASDDPKEKLGGSKPEQRPEEKIRLYSPERGIDFSDEDEGAEKDNNSRKLIFKYVTSAKTRTFVGEEDTTKDAEPAAGAFSDKAEASGVPETGAGTEQNAKAIQENNIRASEGAPAANGVPSDEDEPPEFDLEFKPTVYNGDYRDAERPEAYANGRYEPRGDESISSLGWMGIIVLLLIPGLNILLLIIWALGGCRKKQKSFFARGVLFIFLIAAFTGVMFATVFRDYLPPVLDTVSKAFSAALRFEDYVLGLIRGFFAR